MKFPTREEGHAAHLQGQGAALAGFALDEANPWVYDSPDFTEGCLARSFRKGWHYGQQINLQRKYGDPPTA